MTKQELIDHLAYFVDHSAGNYISAEDAIFPELAGLKLYDRPLIGFASAADPLFTETFKREGIVSPDYMAPQEWLPHAKTVISCFFPFTSEVKASNRTNIDVPYEEGLPQRSSAAWLHGRIEGQAFINEAMLYLQSLLESEGQTAICPSASGKLRMLTPYISTWSERHAAYAAGLGTFSLSKGLITEKGMAGRIGSVITSAEFSPTVRLYSEPFAYCVMCGACVKRCPAGAIDRDRGCALGKDHTICAPYVNGSKLPPHGPKQVVRYGCGKCQVAVPCENGIPKTAHKHEL